MAVQNFTATGSRILYILTASTREELGVASCKCCCRNLKAGAIELVMISMLLFTKTMAPSAMESLRSHS